MIKNNIDNDEDKDILPVIIAGGFGIRLQQYLKFKIPKQFIKLLLNGNSLFQQTIQRVSAIFPNAKILILANYKHKDIVKRQLAEIDCQNYILILEQYCNNTFLSSLFACKFATKNNYKKIFIFPSDHFIDTDKQFTKSIKSHLKLLKSKNKHILFGIIPTDANTQYGYIGLNMDINVKNNIFDVMNFVEKPPMEMAIKLLNNGNYLWNSGIFLIDVDIYLNEIKKYQQSSYEVYKNIHFNVIDKNGTYIIKNIANDSMKISMDKAIIEKSKHLLCVKCCNFQWYDIGSAENFYKLIKANKISIQHLH